VVQQAAAAKTTVREVLLAEGLDPAAVDRALDADALARGGLSS
jgi:hypothetical protein